jgi:hypothetical protein
MRIVKGSVFYQEQNGWHTWEKAVTKANRFLKNKILAVINLIFLQFGKLYSHWLFFYCYLLPGQWCRALAGVCRESFITLDNCHIEDRELLSRLQSYFNAFYSIAINSARDNKKSIAIKNWKSIAVFLEELKGSV